MSMSNTSDRNVTGFAGRRISTETKAAIKTTELIAYIAVVVGIFIASAIVDGNNGHGDPFSAQDAWRYVTYLTIGYLVSRGLAKSGSRDFYDDDDAARTRR